MGGDSWEDSFDDQLSTSEEEDLFGDADEAAKQVKFTHKYDSDLGFEEESVTTPYDSPDKDNKRQEIDSMSDFDDAVAQAVSNIPECLAGGVVDMESGMLVGVKTVDSHPQEVLDMLSAATHDLFQGQNVVAIENMFKKARGLELDDFHYFKEILVNSENLIHVFLRGKQNPQFVITFACRISANLGMVLAKARSQVPVLEQAI